MKILILETNEIKFLSLEDTTTGVNYAVDFISDRNFILEDSYEDERYIPAGHFIRKKHTDPTINVLYICHLVDYEWWVKTLRIWQSMEHQRHNIDADKSEKHHDN